MNRNQRILLVVALVVIGAVLPYAMTSVDANALDPRYDTGLYSWKITNGGYVTHYSQDQAAITRPTPGPTAPALQIYRGDTPPSGWLIPPGWGWYYSPFKQWGAYPDKSVVEPDNAVMGHPISREFVPPLEKHLYIAHGLVGILLGLIVPIFFWTAAAYVALGRGGRHA